MAFDTIWFEIEGVTQHMQHNGQLADPQCRYVIEMSKITSKPAKKRTSEDIARLEDLEWEGSLYLNENGRVIVPGSVIEGAMFEAGKVYRDGQVVRNGLQSGDDWLLDYEGPKDLEALRLDPRFHSRVMVRNPSTKARVARSRPIFRRWGLTFAIQYHTGMLSREDIVKMVNTLGDQIGLSDDRKKMGGRFIVKKHD